MVQETTITMKLLVTQMIEKLFPNRKVKVKKNIITNILGNLVYHEIPLELINSFFEDAKSHNLYTSLSFINGTLIRSNIFDHLKNPNYKPLLESLFTCKPNTGTPRASTGDFEIALLLTLPNANKPSKGDIEFLGNVLNIKDFNPNIFAEVRGNELNKKMLNVLKKHSISPRIYRGVKYGQLLNKNYIKQFNQEFQNNNITINQVRDILFTWLVNVFPNLEIPESEINLIIDKSIDGNQIVWSNWSKHNLIFFYKYSTNRKEKLVSISQDGDVFHLPQDIDEFTHMVENDEIRFHKDYCRLNSSEKCGIYLDVSKKN